MIHGHRHLLTRSWSSSAKASASLLFFYLSKNENFVQIWQIYPISLFSVISIPLTITLTCPQWPWPWLCCSHPSSSRMPWEQKNEMVGIYLQMIEWTIDRNLVDIFVQVIESMMNINSSATCTALHFQSLHWLQKPRYNHQPQNPEVFQSL